MNKEFTYNGVYAESLVRYEGWTIFKSFIYYNEYFVYTYDGKTINSFYSKSLEEAKQKINNRMHKYRVPQHIIQRMNENYGI